MLSKARPEISMKYVLKNSQILKINYVTGNTLFEYK